MNDKWDLPAAPQPGRQLVKTPRPDPAKRADLLARVKARDPGSSPGQALIREPVQALANPRPIPPALPHVPPPVRLWNCNCAGFGGALHTHCGGSSLLFCQCGKREPRHFHDIEKIQARGASVASASLVVGRSIVRR